VVVNLSAFVLTFTHVFVLTFIFSALSVANNLNSSLLSTSTRQEICGMVVVVYRFCLFLLVYFYVSAKTHCVFRSIH
jgi:hypothetical protein